MLQTTGTCIGRCCQGRASTNTPPWRHAVEGTNVTMGCTLFYYSSLQALFKQWVQQYIVQLQPSIGPKGMQLTRTITCSICVSLPTCAAHALVAFHARPTMCSPWKASGAFLRCRTSDVVQMEKQHRHSHLQQHRATHFASLRSRARKCRERLCFLHLEDKAWWCCWSPRFRSSALHKAAARETRGHWHHSTSCALVARRMYTVQTSREQYTRVQTTLVVV